MSQIKKYRTTKAASETCVYYVGQNEDMKAIYKSIARNRHTAIKVWYFHAPRHSEYNQIYALRIDKNGLLTVANSNEIQAFLIRGYVASV